MKRIRLTEVEKPRQFGGELVMSRLLVVADLVDLVKEGSDYRTVFIGHGIGPMIVNESYDEINKVLDDN